MDVNRNILTEPNEHVEDLFKTNAPELATKNLGKIGLIHAKNFGGLGLSQPTISDDRIHTMHESGFSRHPDRIFIAKVFINVP